jgi:hypothetical protein
VYYLLDCAPTLDACAAEVEAGLAFVRRTGNEQTGQWLDSYRRLAGVLRGESPAAAGEAIPVDTYAGQVVGGDDAGGGRRQAAVAFIVAPAQAASAAAVSQMPRFPTESS